MTREEVKRLLPMIQAFAEGKTVQVKIRTGNETLTEKWEDMINPEFDATRCYRIKPELTYRPFKDTEECWEEMQKHEPFGIKEERQ